MYYSELYKQMLLYTLSFLLWLKAEHLEVLQNGRRMQWKALDP